MELETESGTATMAVAVRFVGYGAYPVYVEETADCSVTKMEIRFSEAEKETH